MIVIIPEWLAQLEDTLSKGMSLDRSKAWPAEFAEAINTGVDLYWIKTPFIIYILEQNIQVQTNNLKNIKDKDVKNAITLTIEANELMLEAQKSRDDTSLLSAARSAADSAVMSAETAAWSAEWSAAKSIKASDRSAARLAAAESAKSASFSAAAADSAVKPIAESIAESVMWSAAAESAAKLEAKSIEWVAARRPATQSIVWLAPKEPAVYEKYADKLLELIKGCK